MMRAELLIIAALATYRLTYLISSESGPADILGRMRSRMGVKYDQYSNAYGTGWLSEGILCFYCTSVWVGIMIAIGLLLIPMITEAVCLPFALAGFASFLKRWAG